MSSAGDSIGSPSALEDSKKGQPAMLHALSPKDDERFMRLALEQARNAAEAGEVPVGAIVVYQPMDKATRKPLADPEVIARASNLRETTNRAFAHAEFLAMQQAMEALDRWRLTDCTVYVTLEPCVMCAGLMQQARVARCVFGAYDGKGGAAGSLYAINEDERLNHRFEVVGGVLEEECAGFLRDFFKSRRAGR